MKTNRPLIPRPAIQFDWSWLLALLLAAGTTGCVVVPFPVPQKDTYSARTNLTSQSSSQFKPGQSSKKEVILALGEPDAVSVDEHKLSYRSEKDVGAFLGIILGPPIVMPFAGDITKEWAYTFKFNAQDCLEKVSQTNGYSYPELPSPRWPDSDRNHLPAWLAGQRLWRSYTNCNWYAGVDGLKSFSNGQFASYLDGHLILTESNLYFFSNDQFANAEPVLKLPLASVTAVRVDKSHVECLLAVNAEPDQVHSFRIERVRGILGEIFSNRAAEKSPTRAACDFIQSKIKPTSTEP